jgi:hypothetical protein
VRTAFLHALAAVLVTSAAAGAATPSARPSGAPPPSSALPPGHPSLAAPADSGTTAGPSALPPGHPALGGDSADEADEGDSEAAEEQRMPPGHPGAPGGGQATDSVAAAPNLPPGTIEVRVADAQEQPLGDLPVRLGIVRQDVATGDSKQERVLRSNGLGMVTFQNMPVGTEYSYRVTVPQGEAAYASEPFRLDERTGQRAVIHVYPATRDIRQAMVGMRGVVYVQPREDIFQVETTLQVLNIGSVAWVPDNVRIPLPEGAKAFRASESMSDARVERDKDGEVTLHGTFSPGQREVTFQYQLENLHEPTARFRMGLPPHVAEMRVFAEGPRDMHLIVSGYPPSERTTGQNGGHLLVTGKRAVRGDAPLDDVEVSLENLPVPAQGRWYAALLAFGLAAFGVWHGFSRGRWKSKTAPYRAELEEAEELVYRELVALERLERDGHIGPRAYAEARTELLDVLSRLGSRNVQARAS